MSQDTNLQNLIINKLTKAQYDTITPSTTELYLVTDDIGVTADEILPSQTGNSGKYLTTDGTVSSWGTVEVLPSQTSQAGKFLTTDGTIASWGTVEALPSQSGNSGKYLTTDGTVASWGTVDTLPSQTDNANKFLTTDGTVASWGTAMTLDTPQTVTSKKTFASSTAGATFTSSAVATFTSSGYINCDSSSGTHTITDFDFRGRSGNYSYPRYIYNKSTSIEIAKYGSTPQTDIVIDGKKVYNGATGLIPNSRISPTLYTAGTGVQINFTGIDLSEWTVTTSSNIYYADNWYSLAYDSSTYVILGRSSYISTSTDGTTWTTPTRPFSISDDLYAIAYGNNKFVILSYYESYISTSTDGTTWTTPAKDTTLGTNKRWKALCYDGTKFVALGERGYISTSTDGTTWTTPTQVSPLSNYYWYSLVYNGSMFVAGGDSGVATSTDGTTWTYTSTSSGVTPIYNIYSIIWDGSKFVGATSNKQVITSTDGTTWTIAGQINSNREIYCGTYTGTKYLFYATRGEICEASTPVSREISVTGGLPSQSGNSGK